jgi:hypothetical protein
MARAEARAGRSGFFAATAGFARRRDNRYSEITSSLNVIMARAEARAGRSGFFRRDGGLLPVVAETATRRSP